MLLAYLWMNFLICETNIPTSQSQKSAMMSSFSSFFAIIKLFPTSGLMWQYMFPINNAKSASCHRSGLTIFKQSTSVVVQIPMKAKSFAFRGAMTSNYLIQFEIKILDRFLRISILAFKEDSTWASLLGPRLLLNYFLIAMLCISNIISNVYLCIFCLLKIVLISPLKKPSKSLNSRRFNHTIQIVFMWSG